MREASPFTERKFVVKNGSFQTNVESSRSLFSSKKSLDNLIARTSIFLERNQSRQFNDWTIKLNFERQNSKFRHFEKNSLSGVEQTAKPSRHISFWSNQFAITAVAMYVGKEKSIKSGTKKSVDVTSPETAVQTVFWRIFRLLVATNLNKKSPT